MSSHRAATCVLMTTPFRESRSVVRSGQGQGLAGTPCVSHAVQLLLNTSSGTRDPWWVSVGCIEVYMHCSVP